MCGVSTWRHTLLARARIKSHVLPLIQTAVYTFIGEKKKKLWEFAVTRATKQENETLSIVRETDKCKNRLPFLQVYFGT